jgi:hypothetical protein
MGTPSVNPKAKGIATAAVTAADAITIIAISVHANGGFSAAATREYARMAVSADQIT